MARPSEVTINNFTWGISTIQSWEMKDNQLVTASNMYYNKEKQLITRWWYKEFLAKISTKPVTSYFFHQRDDGNGKYCLAVCGDVMYSYNETESVWVTIKSWLTELETNTVFNWARTRWDFAVYNNIVYMCNWVDNYASYAGITPAFLTGGTSATNVVATRNAVTNGTFRITINGVVRDITGLNFATDTTMEQIASRIQTAIRALTWKLETVVWSTNKFIISSSLATLSSAITVTSAQGTWTDISWVWGTAFMDSETGRGTVTAVANTYTEYSTQPKCRYIQYLWDRIYWAWEDANPITLYYTWAVPSNANTLNANFVKVWGDETGAINGLSEIWNLIVAIKDVKVYVINPVAGTATPIDSQWWGFCNRSLKNVWNSLVFFNEKWVDTLQQRDWVTGSTALDTKSISSDVLSLFNQVDRKNYNFQCSMYNRFDQKYYICIDSNNDTIPDYFMVYSSITWWWTTYNLPSMFDMWIFIDSSQDIHYIFAWTDWQLYEFETGAVDYWQNITHAIETKRLDSKSPWKIKSHTYVDIIWYKSLSTNINVWIYWEWLFYTGGEITDTNIRSLDSYKTIWSKSVWSKPLWWSSIGDEIIIYKYSVRLTTYIPSQDISIKLDSEWGTRTMDRISIWVEWQPLDVFYSDQYL